MTFRRRLAATLAVALVCLLGPLGFDAANAATPVPDTSSNVCTGSYYGTVGCFQIIGTGLYVDQWLVSIANHNGSTYYVSDRVVGPYGYNTGWHLNTIPAHSSVYPDVDVYSNEPAGTYCAQFDIYSAPVVQVCNTVHA